MRAALQIGTPLERLVTWLLALVDLVLVAVGVWFLLFAFLMEGTYSLVARQAPTVAPFLIALVGLWVTFGTAFLMIAAVPRRWVLQAGVFGAWLAVAVWTLLG